jgi:hypothetical protein
MMPRGKYPSKTHGEAPSKTSEPVKPLTYAQQLEYDKRFPSKKQPFGYRLYNNPWVGGPLYYLFGGAAGGPQKAKADEEMRLHEEKRRAEEELRLREERIRKANADKEKLLRIQAQAKEDREEQERTDRHYEELDRKNREEEGRGRAI